MAAVVLTTAETRAPLLRYGFKILPFVTSDSFTSIFFESDSRLGVLQSLEEVIPHMASKLMDSAWPVRLMQLAASILERTGRVTRAMERHEQMHITRCHGGPGGAGEWLGWREFGRKSRRTKLKWPRKDMKKMKKLLLVWTRDFSMFPLQNCRT